MAAKAAGTVGVLGAPVVARVDERGVVHLDDCALGWLVGAEDRWHDPRTDAAVRHWRKGPAPAFETRMRVPTGDAIHRAYGARARDGRAYAVVEVENASPAPFAVAFVLRALHHRRSGPIALDGVAVRVGSRPALLLPRPPMRWATGTDAGDDAVAIVTGGAAREDTFEAVAGVDAEAVFVYPLAHRARLRVALALSEFPRDASVPAEGSLASLPDLGAVQHGWGVHLDRAMRVELPDGLEARVDAARATALVLGAPGTGRAVAELADWGFDDEAAASWSMPASGAQRVITRPQTRRRADATRRWDDLRAALARGDDERILTLTRRVLLWVGRKDLDFVPGFPAEWVGHPIAVHDAPTHAGPVSFAVRWHGDRPALLWDAPERFTLRAPVLDPSWSAPGGRGEALLRAWPAQASEGGAFS